MYVFLAQPVINITRGAELSGVLRLAFLALTAALSLTAALAAHAAALREARVWRPRAD
ncbi:hypothetical protein ACIGXG_35525 [Streptomyces goshikiensis]|uniref:hypothetical protein n=1 Tax=Streptomyces goshikiensis TaxID=1942 RepID=UPI0037D11432